MYENTNTIVRIDTSWIAERYQNTVLRGLCVCMSAYMCLVPFHLFRSVYRIRSLYPPIQFTAIYFSICIETRENDIHDVM